MTRGQRIQDSISDARPAPTNEAVGRLGNGPLIGGRSEIDG